MWTPIQIYWNKQIKRPIGSPRSKAKGQKKELGTNPQKAKKLSFNEMYLLKTLPDQLAALEEKIQVVELKMADPDFYQADPVAFDKTAADLEKLKSELEQPKPNGWNYKSSKKK